MNRTVPLLICLLAALASQAQPTGTPMHAPAYHIIDRLDIRGGVAHPIHTQLKVFSRKDLVGFAAMLDSLSPTLSKGDRADLQYLFDDNNEWAAQIPTRQSVWRMNAQGLPDETPTLQYTQPKRGILGLFYRTPANFFEVDKKHFYFRANPMLNLQFGKAANDSALLFKNERGIELRGGVDDKVWFYTNIIETQARFPNYVNRYLDDNRALPGVGFYKNYASEIFDIDNGYDFNVATAYIGFQATKHIGVQLGHGRHFIGNGYRSLLLSDFAFNDFFLKINTRIWKLHYQNLIMELNPIGQGQQQTNDPYPKKYAAIHYFSFKPLPNISAGFYEATIFNRPARRFELQYLNPVILYRSVEGLIGSPDNVMIGFDAKWNIKRRFQVYGQFLLDEFKFSEIYKPAQKGWWGNKYAAQIGLKYINALGIDHLDVQAEYNKVRPYTYAHFDSLSAFTHFNQPLAHPLWANFKEWVVKARYQPIRPLVLQARYIASRGGENAFGENWGANPLLDYDSRERDYDNTTGQGVRTNIRLFGLDASWEIYHNMFFDLNILFRKKDSADDRRDLQTRYISGGFRMNLWKPALDF